ncbi:MAG: Do family serine endopeptidase [Verrucomicrobiales bacterium]
MKQQSPPLKSLMALAGVFALTLQGVAAEETKFADLKEKLTFDKSSAESENGLASYAPALEKVMPAVVTVFSSKTFEAERDPRQEELFRRMFPDIPDDFFEKRDSEGRRQEGLGSGVVISEDGYIVTNNHVVGEADEIKVTLPDSDKEYVAELVGGDPRTDVALIKIDAEGLKTITIGDSSKLRVGDVVLAVGNPLQLNQSASIGIVSALGRSELNITQGGFENFIQTDAAINRGNSGGALVDANGRLIGINTAIQSNFTGGNIGIGFAIPSNMTLDIVERLLEGGGTVQRGFLGVFLRELDANLAKALGRDVRNGVLVTEVGDDTPAEGAGFKPGDLIVDYNGDEVESMQQLRLDISNTAPGEKVTFGIIRNGKERELDATLGDLDDNTLVASRNGSSQQAPKPREIIEGVGVKDIDEEAREALQLDDSITGIVVESVEDNSAAAEAGLRPGTIITQIDQTDVTSVEEAYDIVDNFESDVLLLQIYVGGRRDILAVPLGG